MSEHAPRHHRHHKEHKARRGVPPHAGGRRPHPEGTGLQLPEHRYSVEPGIPRTIYPPGWKLKQVTLNQTAILIAAVILVLMGLALVLLKLLAG